MPPRFDCRRRRGELGKLFIWAFLAVMNDGAKNEGEKVGARKDFQRLALVYT